MDVEIAKAATGKRLIVLVLAARGSGQEGAGKCGGGTGIVARWWRGFLKVLGSTQSFERMNDRRKRFGHDGNGIGPGAKVVAHNRSLARSLDTINRVPGSSTVVGLRGWRRRSWTVWLG